MKLLIMTLAILSFSVSATQTMARRMSDIVRDIKVTDESVIVLFKKYAAAYNVAKDNIKIRKCLEVSKQSKTKVYLVVDNKSLKILKCK